MPRQQPDYDPTNIHSKKKLDVYISYLNIYLKVLLRAFPKEIHIYDMFAGKGKYGSSLGSALKALEAIEELSPTYYGKRVCLHLNEYNREYYNILRSNIPPKLDWVYCTNKDVNEAIESCLTKDFRKKSEVFYLDPYGYTQIKRASIDKIMARPKAECLLFVPVSRIAQFVKSERPLEEQEKSIAKFLEEYEIPATSQIQWNTLGETIKNSLAEIYSKKYVGMVTLPTETANYYALYFIGNHIYGLDRFIYSVERVEREANVQLTLFSKEYEKFKSDLCEYLSKQRTNNDLCVWGLRQGWLYTDTEKVLVDLEKDRKLDVSEVPGSKKRQSNKFYLDYRTHYNKPPRIYVKIKPEGRLWELNGQRKLGIQ